MRTGHVGMVGIQLTSNLDLRRSPDTASFFSLGLLIERNACTVVFNSLLWTFHGEYFL